MGESSENIQNKLEKKIWWDIIITVKYCLMSTLHTRTHQIIFAFIKMCLSLLMRMLDRIEPKQAETKPQHDVVCVLWTRWMRFVCVLFFFADLLIFIIFVAKMCDSRQLTQRIFDFFRGVYFGVAFAHNSYSYSLMVFHFYCYFVTSFIKCATFFLSTPRKI